MKQEKYSLISSLTKQKEILEANDNYVSLVGQGDFPGANNVMRSAMNIKHQTQHLTIDRPEFPFLYDGKENTRGEFSTFYYTTDKEYKVINIIKKYNELLKGKCYVALYFLYCKEDDSYILIERKEIENLTETFGFSYNNEFLDNSEVGDLIPKDTLLYNSTSYDRDLNVSVGVNGRILYASHPGVQDDAIIISESFAKRMVCDKVTSKSIPINDNTILLNLYGDDNEYKGIPDIGESIQDGILAAARTIKETRMFSDLRDSSLKNINLQLDQVYYADGEIIDINVYVNNPNIKINKVNQQLVRYYNDSKWFYTEVYKTCKSILNSGSKNIDIEVNRWLRKSMDFLDAQAQWAFNDNVFSNMMLELFIRKKEPITIGRKLVGRSGNKTITSNIWPDEEMPYLTDEVYRDKNGVVHSKGEKTRVELITNSLAIVNRTIPMALIESSVTFITDKIRKHLVTLSSLTEQEELLFDVIKILNKEQGDDLEGIYKKLSNKDKERFMKDTIEKGIFIRWEAFSKEQNMRDSIIKIHEKYKDIVQPSHVFVPKNKWGRDIYIGQDYVGFQYMMLLKQSGESGFSVRSAGAISDESLPEKTNDHKIGKSLHSEKPIQFGEYETPNFMIITNPEDFALVTALYRSSIDGRRFMYEAILSEDGRYNIPDHFNSRTAEILQVYLKSLGIRMETIYDEDEYIRDESHNEIVGYPFGPSMIFCTGNEMYYLKKLRKVFKRYKKEYPSQIMDVDEVWDYILENLPFDKEKLTDNIIKLFKNNLSLFIQY